MFKLSTQSWKGAKISKGVNENIIAFFRFFRLTLKKSENPIILHFEDVSERKLETPALPMIQHIISVLVTEKQTIKNCIKCSIFQAKTLDNVTKTIRDLFLSLYIPIRPLIVTDDTGAIENFVGTMVSSC